MAYPSSCVGVTWWRVLLLLSALNIYGKLMRLVNGFSWRRCYFWHCHYMYSYLIYSILCRTNVYRSWHYHIAVGYWIHLSKLCTLSSSFLSACCDASYLADFHTKNALKYLPKIQWCIMQIFSINFSSSQRYRKTMQWRILKSNITKQFFDGIFSILCFCLSCFFSFFYFLLIVQVQFSLVLGFT